MTILLIIHLLVAVTLLGAITHQALSVWWPAPAAAASIGARYRSVHSGVYTNAIVILFVVAALLGAVLYPAYRTGVLPFIYQAHLKPWGGVFELKEHFAAIGLGLLPIYWYAWKGVAFDRHVRLRAILTAVLAVFVWYAFFVGHLINNIHGLPL